MPLIRRNEALEKVLRTEFSILEILSDKELQDLQRLAALMTHTPLCSVTVSENGRLYFRSPKQEHITSLPLGETICNRTIQNGCDYEVPDMLQSEFAGHDVCTGELGMRSYYGVVLKDSEGRSIGTLCVLDQQPRVFSSEQKESLHLLARSVITHFELRKSSMQLEKTKSVYLKLIEDAGDVIYTCNLEGHFTFVNRQFQKFLGFPDLSNQKVHFSELIAEMYKDEIIKFYHNQFRTLTPESIMQFPIITANGTEKWIEQTVTLNFRNGKPEGFQGIVRDIDSRKKAEEELQRLITAKEQFLANMSHEIRTPMNAMLGFTELLAKSKLNREQKEFVKAINSSGNNLLHIINNILDYSKYEAGMLQLEKIPVNPRSMLSDLKQLFGTEARKKGLLLKTTVAAGMPNFLGDPVRLGQVLSNIVSNALKFTESGSITISAETQTLADQEQLIIRVSDTGIGIADHKKAAIFERFTQASNDTTRKFGGTGLGLTIAKTIVDMHGGSLCVEDTPGGGSTFIVALPLHRSAAGTRNRRIHGKAATAAGSRVLVVEDNKLNQKLALRTLKDAGISTELAANGLEAIEKFRSGEYDVILMDVQMPEMDGFEATRRIREADNCVPVIGLSAQPQEIERHRCMEAGMNEYMSKPYKAADLIHAISRFSGKNIQARKRTAAASSPQKLDLQKVHKLAAGDHGFVREVLHIFIDDTRTDLRNIRKGIRGQRHSDIKRAAHNLKSGTALFSLGRDLQKLLQQMEDLATENGDLKKIDGKYRKVYQRLHTATNLAEAELQRL
jgi:PAS domain S-box-containing protein